MNTPEKATLVAIKESKAAWWHLLLAHLWGAACWVRPGWFPATIALVSVLLAGLALYRDRLEWKKAEERSW